MSDDDYARYRGKCREYSEALVAGDSSLRLVRGYYYDPYWGRQPHWWCRRADGTIIDPTKDQFPSKGHGIYEEFNGVVECAECGRQLFEAEARLDSNYAFCSDRCNAAFVGVCI